ncbi:MAG: hypothetical protein KGI33_03265 [Thaumarchaeota archaeon]|nr:hypothetical protein [Nitrososphaerota archaeon]
MHDSTGGEAFDGIWRFLGRHEPESISREDGYRWGLLHIEYVKKELQKLEERALNRRDEEMLHSIVNSKLRALEVQEELRKSLTNGV